MDSTEAAFIVATGTIRGERLTAELNRAGPPDVLAHLAILIADAGLHKGHSH